MVYFDNFSVSHELSSLREETHYYPFGLTMAGISSRAIGKLDNKYGFNGNELQKGEFVDGSGLDAYDFNFRTYDPQIGRFYQIDPLSEILDNLSPFSFANNNPILLNDVLGLAGDTSTLPEVIVPGKRPHKEAKSSPGTAIKPPPVNPTPPGYSPNSRTPQQGTRINKSPNQTVPTSPIWMRGLGTLALLLMPIETGLGADKPAHLQDWPDFKGHGNNKNNTNEHIVYEFSYKATDGKTPILKYGISDYHRNGTSRPENQIAGFALKYGNTVTYKILTRTINRAEAMAIEFDLVRGHIDVWNYLPLEQKRPIP